MKKNKDNTEVINLLLSMVKQLEDNVLWILKQLDKTFDFIESILTFLSNAMKKSMGDNNSGNIN